jgi:hypothetical protein
MRKLINNPVSMTFDEMEEHYIGKWILVANCEYGEYGDFLRGIPVAVADSPFEGQTDGFYEKFKNKRYSPRTDMDFDYDNVPGLKGLFGTLDWVGEER